MRIVAALREVCAALALAVSWAVPSAAGADVPQGDDIVVVGRKLSAVRLKFTLADNMLRQCTVVRSSGDVAADETVCGILRICIRRGANQPEMAELCIDQRVAKLIALMEQGAGEEIHLPPDIVLAIKLNAGRVRWSETNPVSEGNTPRRPGAL